MEWVKGVVPPAWQIHCCWTEPLRGEGRSLSGKVFFPFHMHAAVPYADHIVTAGKVLWQAPFLEPNCFFCGFPKISGLIAPASEVGGREGAERTSRIACEVGACAGWPGAHEESARGRMVLPPRIGWTMENRHRRAEPQ